jgi:hypothetical protein
LYSTVGRKAKADEETESSLLGAERLELLRLGTTAAVARMYLPTFRNDGNRSLMSWLPLRFVWSIYAGEYWTLSLLHGEIHSMARSWAEAEA